MLISTYYPAPPVSPTKIVIASAKQWATNGEFWIGHDRAWEMPLTAVTFGVFYRLLPDDTTALLAIRLFQSFLIVTQSCLLFCIARRLFPHLWVAVMAAGILAFYPFFIFYQGMLLSETLFNTFLLGAFWGLYRWRQSGCRVDGHLVVFILLAALATYTKASLTFLPPLLAAVVAWATIPSWRRTAVVLLAALALYAGAMGPWWARNYTLLHVFVPFSTSSTLNLYVGNNAGNYSGGNDWIKDTDYAQMQQIQSIQDELVRQNAFRETAMAFIRENPARFSELFLRRFVRFWNVAPNAESYNQGASRLLSIVSFTPILALNLIGLWVLRAQWKTMLPIYVLIAYFTLLHSITIASLRYRLPLEPLLILLACGTLGTVWSGRNITVPAREPF